MPASRSPKTMLLVVLVLLTSSACTPTLPNPFAPARGASTGPKLRTSQDATAAGFKLVPGKKGEHPTVVDVQRMGSIEWIAWLDERGIPSEPGSIDPSSTIWVLEFTNAALPQPCSAADPAGCVHDHLFLSLDAMSGKSLGFLFPKGGAPANYTP